jgi:hypothetical protein
VVAWSRWRRRHQAIDARVLSAAQLVMLNGHSNTRAQWWRAEDAWTPLGEEEGVVSGTARRLIAELLGTFALTFVAAGGEVFAILSGGRVTTSASAVAPGLIVMALTYAIGNVSGAHFNPAVTFAFALRRAFP